MCFSQSAIIGLNSYNWDGDRIYFDPIVPSHRAVIGKASKVTYQLDVREFLTGDNNAVMRKAVTEDVPAFALSIAADMSLFSRRGAGGFDYRASIIAQYVSHSLRYRTRKQHDPWRFPEETLMVKEGDCEDIAFLLASLLYSAGISPYNIRVALGKVFTSVDGKEDNFDHAWVMYKRESGKWMILEPLDLVTAKRIVKKSLKPATILLPTQPICIYEYKPSFLFNWEHLWVCDNGSEESLQDIVNKAWNRMDPTFAGFVHNNIIHAALSDAPKWVINELDKRFTHIVPFVDSTIVDEPDWPGSYDPYDHFDSGFIKEGWESVTKRLAAFKANNHAIGNFAWAAHGIADFYAHSSYVHFAKLVSPKMTGGHAVRYDPDHPAACFETPPVYDQGLFDFKRFSINSRLYTEGNSQAAALWQGKIISGRYAQKPDSRPPGVFEQLVKVPSAISKQAAYYQHGALPHHDEIAVDEPESGKEHILYTRNTTTQLDDRGSYANQYRWRYFSAVQHIRLAFFSNWHS